MKPMSTSTLLANFLFVVGYELRLTDQKFEYFDDACYLFETYYKGQI
jgi:hypothetical protein